MSPCTGSQWVLCVKTPFLAELREHQSIGGKRKGVVWLRVQRHVLEGVDIIGSRHRAAGDHTTKPDAHGLYFEVVKVRVDGEYITDLDRESRFLEKFTFRGISNVLVIFDIAAGDAPLPGVNAA